MSSAGNKIYFQRAILKIFQRDDYTPKTAACQSPKFGMESRVSRFFCLLRRKRANAKENQMQTKLSFLTGGERIGSNTLCLEFDTF